jgi:hypothetical protein
MRLYNMSYLLHLATELLVSNDETSKTNEDVDDTLKSGLLLRRTSLTNQALNSVHVDGLETPVDSSNDDQDTSDLCNKLHIDSCHDDECLPLQQEEKKLLESFAVVSKASTDGWLVPQDVP